jgi:hypothetical protein
MEKFKVLGLALIAVVSDLILVATILYLIVMVPTIALPVIIIGLSTYVLYIILKKP